MNDLLEDTLRQIDPGPPPVDMVDRCIAALPERTPKPTLFAGLLKRVTQSATPRRLVFAVAALAIVAVWTTRPTARRNGTMNTSDSAFAETISAMSHVTSWRAVSLQIGFEPGNGKTKFHYDFKHGWIKNTEWFDARQGIYSDEPNRDGVTFQRSLMLPNGNWYFRRADHSIGWDKTRITKMGKPYWEKMRNEQLNNIRNPAYWANNFDRAATVPSTSRFGNWRGRPALVFTFDVAPSVFYKASDPPTKRTEIYVDSASRLIIARREFARWPNHPERGENATWIQEFDYATPPTPGLFDAKRFCAGTKEIQKREGNANDALNPM